MKIGSCEYGPFGEVVRASGGMAGANPFQFSTKYMDSETGLSCYGFRYYNASTGRWLNRDSIEEQGGLNLYGFVQNNPPSRIDHLGLEVDENTQDTDSLPLSPDPNLPTGTGMEVYGQTRPDIYGPGFYEIPLFIGGCWYLIPFGNINISLYYNSKLIGDPSIGPPYDPQGRTVAQHERQHAWIFKKWWNAMAEDMNSLEGKHCCKCADLAKQLLAKMHEVYFDQTAADNAAQDGQVGPKPDWNGLQKLKDDYSAAGCWK